MFVCLLWCKIYHEPWPIIKFEAACLLRWKLAWFRHVTRHDSLSDSLSTTVLQGTLEVGRCCGRQRKCWMDNIKKWTSLPMPELLTRASCREDWKRIPAESSLMSPRRPNWSGNWTEWNRGSTVFVLRSLPPTSHPPRPPALFCCKPVLFLGGGEGGQYSAVLVARYTDQLKVLETLAYTTCTQWTS